MKYDIHTQGVSYDEFMGILLLSLPISLISCSSLSMSFLSLLLLLVLLIFSYFEASALHLSNYTVSLCIFIIYTTIRGGRSRVQVGVGAERKREKKEMRGNKEAYKGKGDREGETERTYREDNR